MIAADGVRSCVRDSLGLVGARRKYQDGIIRVLLERTDLEGGHWNHVIDFWAFTPRTLRILYAPCENGQRYFGMMAPVEAKDASTLPIDPAVWAPSFPAFAPALKLIGSRGRHDVYETTRLDTWSVGRVAIVGDAAHAMPPTLAQGACCAMMNALSLAVFVSDGSDVAGALQRWQAQERGLTDHTQARSAELARTRALGSGMQWDDVGLRAALHVPTGTQPEAYAPLRAAGTERPGSSLSLGGSRRFCSCCRERAERRETAAPGSLGLRQVDDLLEPPELERPAVPEGLSGNREFDRPAADRCKPGPGTRAGCRRHSETAVRPRHA